MAQWNVILVVCGQSEINSHHLTSGYLLIAIIQLISQIIKTSAAISRSSQYSTTGLTKAVVYVILSVG